MIYLVTEDQKILDMITGRLRKMGKSALGISRPEELFTRLRQIYPDIIILDGNCAHLDTLKILKDLKAAGYKGQTIVLGGGPSDPSFPEVSRYGAIQTAGRPLAINRVLGAIRIAQEHLNADLYGHVSANRLEVLKGSVHEVQSM